MITELVLATDMELHSSQLKQMETILENDKLEKLVIGFVGTIERRSVIKI